MLESNLNATLVRWCIAKRLEEQMTSTVLIFIFMSRFSISPQYYTGRLKEKATCEANKRYFTEKSVKRRWDFFNLDFRPNKRNTFTEVYI